MGILSILTTLLGLICLGSLPASALTSNALDEPDDPLAHGFSAPPPEARPRVWWHWMNGNIDPFGIAKDLEWMHRIGIGGVQNFDVAMETPLIVNKRLAYMSPEWQDAFGFAVKKADELGLEFAVASSSGWSLTGGPWVPPEDAMKKLVWTETVVDGGGGGKHVLETPPGVPGPYHSLSAVYKHAHNPNAVPEYFYRDVAVLAYPVYYSASVPVPEAILANGEGIDQEALVDGVLSTGIPLPGQYDGNAGAVEFRYAEPQTIQSLVIYIANLPSGILQGALKPHLEVQQENGEWRTVVEVDMSSVPTTVSFSPVTSDMFRIVFGRDRPDQVFRFAPVAGIDLAGLAGLGSLTPDAPVLMDLRLLPQPSIHRFEAKAGFALVNNYHALNDEPEQPLSGIQPTAVLDLSEHLSDDGMLNWEVPPGRWKILRLGYSLTGKTNSPATVEATGLEVDKYDGDAVRRYLDHYLGMYRQVLGDELIGERGLNALLTDSTEAGPSNWTPRLPEHFARLRGYDLLPWMPALTGEIIGTREQSNKFLYDFRLTLAELNATEHYGTVAGIAHRDKLTVYGESLEGNRLVSTLGDDLELRRFADIPMAAMWTFAPGGEPEPRYVADMRGAASVAHIYGKRCAAAESLTSIMAPWAHGPAELQPMIDAEFLNGINCPVIHTSPHQPVDDKTPGLSLHVFGQYFTRHETWAEMAKPWMDYIARNSFLLQQGRHVADVAYLYGVEPPISVLAGAEGLPDDLPKGFGYDFLPSHALLNELNVVDGELVSSGGARYAVLFLGASSHAAMTVPVLQRLVDLVEQGATLVGLPPAKTPSLADDDNKFDALVARLWSGQIATEVGKGRVIAASRVESVLNEMGKAPDFEAGAESGIGFVHREMNNGELYFVANRGPKRKVVVKFRVTGKVPEIWRADTGTIEPVSYRINDGITEVPLSMQDWESFHVVFRRPASENSLEVPGIDWETVHEFDSPWQVTFSRAKSVPAQTEFEDLIPLSEHPSRDIRYFSGVTNYHNTFAMGTSTGDSLRLELGEVADVAEVYINGNHVGTAWKAPYYVDISQHVQPGENKIEIRVTNLWVNRLIGDRQPDVEPVSYTTFKTYLPNAPLRRAGLIGPVRVLKPKSN